MKQQFFFRFFLLKFLLLSALTACTVPRVDIHQPLTARPAVPTIAAVPAKSTGSIYQDSPSFQPLFEDRRARSVGDTLVIKVEEKINATQQNSTSAQRSASSDLSIPTVTKLPFPGLSGLKGEGSSENKFDSKGASAASNILTGNITVTVIEVLPNGNLVVSGEKQIGTNQQKEALRFSGVVNPSNILSGNMVSSNQVADARIEYRGDGAIDSAQTVGWLTRFFFSFLPI